MINEKYFEIEIKKLERLIEGTDESASGESLLSDVIEVKVKIFQILEYSVNHFKDAEGKHRGLGFPILSPNQTIDDLEGSANFSAVKRKLGEDGEKYVREVYDLIFSDPRFTQLLYLDPATKHRNIDQFKEGLISCAEGRWTSVGNTGVSQNSDGSIDIGGIMKLGPGAGVDIRGCTFSSPHGTIYVDQFATKQIKGRKLVITKNQSSAEVQIKPYLAQCIHCVSRIIEIWRKYQ